MGRQYLTIGVNGLVEAAQFLGIEINDNPKYETFVQEVLGIIEKYNKKYRTKEVLFNCEMIPAENVGVKHGNRLSIIHHVIKFFGSKSTFRR